MAQYQNEYEGMGNALMNIGSMYYSQSEKRKEEERLRKEKEDERKYLAAQSEIEWQRRAPADKIKAALAELKLAEAERSKYTVAGNQLIEQRMVRNADGKLEQVEGRETLSPLNPYNQRPAAAPRPVSMDGPQGPGMYIPDGAGGYTKIGNPIPKAQSSTGGLTTAQYLSNLGRIESDRQKVKTMSQFDINQSGSTREAMLKDLATREEQLKKYYTPPTGPLTKQEDTQVAPPADAAAVSLINAGKTPSGAKTNMIPPESTPAYKAAYKEGLAAAEAVGLTGADAIAAAKAWAEQAPD